LAIQFGERDTSPELSQDGATLRYWVTGEPDEFAAQGLIESVTPLQFGGLVRTNVRVEPTGPEMWDGEITYALPQQSEIPQQGQPTFSFDTGGGTQHITQSLATVGTFAPVGITAPNFKGAIGVTADNVEGVDIVVPVYQFSETHVLPDATVTDTYKAALMVMTGRVNSDIFRGFAAGSVLFLGAAGSKRGDGDWEITFRFAVSPNVGAITVGDITGISKKGWEYLWVRYEDAEDAGAQSIVKRPVAAYVERVYTELPFTTLGI